MLPPLVKSKALSALPRHWRWADVLGASKASGRRSPLASGSDRRVSCQSGSKWRSYHFTYSSTIAHVAGWVVMSSIGPSPITHTLRPSRKLSRYSAPVRILLHFYGLRSTPWQQPIVAFQMATAIHGSTNH